MRLAVLLLLTPPPPPPPQPTVTLREALDQVQYWLDIAKGRA